MTQLLDKREEGLRALARMIASAYRRRVTGESVAVSSSCDSDDEQLFPNTRKKNTQPKDQRQEGEYTETVSVENFLRNKNHHFNQETKVVNSKGGENVANKGSIRDRKTATVGQNQARNQKGE